MNLQAAHQHRRTNFLQALLLLGGMGLLLALLGWLLGGVSMMLFTAGAGLVLLWLAPRVSPHWVLRMHGAVPLAPDQAPELYELMRELAQRARLSHLPQLYFVPTRALNAFTVGDRAHSAVAVSRGLLQRLNGRELAGVLAHELSHLRNNDIRLMGLADLAGRLTGALSTVGQVLVLVNLPLVLLGEAHIPWLAILLLIFAPVVSTLLQLALSRTREFDADLGAALLTGDPEGLASALAKLEHHSRGVFEHIFLPSRRAPEPSMLRTHPATEARIQRLRALTPPAPPLDWRPERVQVYRPRSGRVPRRHFWP